MFKLLKGSEPQAAKSMEYTGMIVIQGRNKDDQLTLIYVTKDEAIRIMSDLSEVTK